MGIGCGGGGSRVFRRDAVRDGLRENPVQAEIDLYNRSLEALTRDIVDVSERCGEDTSEMKTIIRDISNDTVPLYEQLPDELGDEKKARILKKYFNLKLKGRQAVTGPVIGCGRMNFLRIDRIIHQSKNAL